MIAEPGKPVSPGEPAPNFSLPAVAGTDTVSLADYRSRSPVFLALFVGLWCPFCRRAIAQMGAMQDKLKAAGVESLGIVATSPENARLYFKYRPTRLRLAADPELITHRAYGVPKPPPTPEMMEAVAKVRINPTGELPAPLPIPDRSGWHCPLGKRRMRHRGSRRDRKIPLRGRDPHRRAGTPAPLTSPQEARPHGRYGKPSPNCGAPVQRIAYLRGRLRT